MKYYKDTRIISSAHRFSPCYSKEIVSRITTMLLGWKTLKDAARTVNLLQRKWKTRWTNLFFIQALNGKDFLFSEVKKSLPRITNNITEVRSIIRRYLLGIVLSYIFTWLYIEGIEKFHKRRCFKISQFLSNML